MLQSLVSSDLRSALDILARISARAHALVSSALEGPEPGFSDRDRASIEAIRPQLGDLFRMSRELAGACAAWGVPAQDEAALTHRECEVIEWLAAGKTDRDIADILGISRRTVHKHLQRIYEKLGVETRTAAVVRALGAATA
jgi:DNA-binding CsgD family transcriptional regulator